MFVKAFASETALVLWQVGIARVGVWEAQVEVDSVVYNTVLAACVSAEQLDQAPRTRPCHRQQPEI